MALRLAWSALSHSIELFDYTTISADLSGAFFLRETLSNNYEDLLYWSWLCGWSDDGHDC